MSDANPQQEPSMEEILASIRRIISEDDDPAAADAPEEAAAEEAPAEEEAAEDESDDVLELTEVAEEPEDEPAEKAEPAEAAADEEPVEDAAEEDLSIDEVLDEVSQEDELELVEDEPESEPVAQPAEAAPAVAAAPVVVQQPVDTRLLATETAAAAAGTLSGLVAAVDRAHGGSVLGDGNRTIEDLVKEVMRPMVKDWLDENLPGLTERLVRREIERLARAAEDD